MDSDHFLAYFDRFREEFDPAFVQWVDENILARWSEKMLEGATKMNDRFWPKAAVR
jgi:hypothetical protein